MQPPTFHPVSVLSSNICVFRPRVHTSGILQLVCCNFLALQRTVLVAAIQQATRVGISVYIQQGCYRLSRGSGAPLAWIPYRLLVVNNDSFESTHVYSSTLTQQQQQLQTTTTTTIENDNNNDDNDNNNNHKQRQQRRQRRQQQQQPQTTSTTTTTTTTTITTTTTNNDNNNNNDNDNNNNHKQRQQQRRQRQRQQ